MKLANKPILRNTFINHALFSQGMGLKESLRGRLTHQEISCLKRAYDVVGDIAILEVDEGLRKKGRQIALALLAEHKHIRTVLRKDSAHEGEFRLQKMKYLAGERRKETVHKESNARIKLDVEKVYFSPRLANERLRIARQVKPGENVLVMFSGCGPYPIVIARNSKPRQVVGIEANPAGHRYAVENARLNKLRNAFFFQGDAREVISSFYSRKIGLKTHISQLSSRMRHRPPILELHTVYDDMERFDEFSKKVAGLAKRTEIVIHAPFRIDGEPLSLAAASRKTTGKTISVLRKLSGLCKRHGLGYVVHVHTRFKPVVRPRISRKALERNLKACSDPRMMLENMPYDSMGADAVAELADRHGLKLCIDLAHLYIEFRGEEFYDKLRELSERQPYFHIADSNMDEFSWEKPHSLPIGCGSMDFSRVVPYIGRGVIEVYSRDENQGLEMIESYRAYRKMLGRFLDFDRIVMPLPKGGEGFLDSALIAAKRGTTIHFYDFQHEDELLLAVKKVRAACRKAHKKPKILSVVKCGQQSPRTYRVCVDFKIV